MCCVGLPRCHWPRGQFDHLFGSAPPLPFPSLPSQSCRDPYNSRFSSSDLEKLSGNSRRIIRLHHMFPCRSATHVNFSAYSSLVPRNVPSAFHLSPIFPPLSRKLSPSHRHLFYRSRPEVYSCYCSSQNLRKSCSKTGNLIIVLEATVKGSSAQVSPLPDRPSREVR